MRNASMRIAPFHGLRYDLDLLKRTGGGDAGRVTSPPYDVISPEEHHRLLDASPFNITRLTLGDAPGAASSYTARGELLERWVREGVLRREEEACFYVYEVSYAVPGTALRRRLLAFVALGELHAFADGIILPHEKTFPKVVSDRKQLLTATRANLETIFVLYSDPARRIEELLEAATRRRPAIRVEARPGEVHALHPVSDLRLAIRLTDLMRSQRPIIADGHHRYTTSLAYRDELRAAGEKVPGADWQMMTFANLHGEGLSILATHRLLALRERSSVSEVLALLDSRLEQAAGGEAEIRVETTAGSRAYRFPDDLKASRRGAAATAYGLLHDVVIGEWLLPWIGADPQVAYFKEGTGELEALRSGAGDVLFGMPPVERDAFRAVVEGGEVFPHKTTYFYPKLWSGLVLWSLEEIEPLALK